MKVLVTGGTGYIGSHTVVELLNSGYEVVVVDNFSNSKPEVIENIKKITGKNFKFYKLNVCSKRKLREIFKENKIDAVIHFAGYKAVGESVQKPLMYYRNNLDSTLTLLEVMVEFNVKNIVFSSSATVYGAPDTLPVCEDARLCTESPYASSKLYIEGILKDLYISDNDFGIAVLRYFNPVGAHDSGLIGEDPNGIPNNLMPYIVKVANKELPMLSIFGNDYDTHDGTGVRDYIHVVDLAEGHISAINYITKHKGIDYYNLGTGKGYSVLDVVSTFSKVNKVDVPYKFAPRRDGDVAIYYADTEKAKRILHWEAKRDLADMVKSSYNYVLKNKDK